MSRSSFHSTIIIGIFAAIVIVSLTGYDNVYAQPVFANQLQGLREFLGPAIDVQKRHNDSLFKIPDVVGTAAGLTESGDPALRVYKKSAAIMNVPSIIEGIPVIVEVTGELRAIPATNKVSFSTRTSINPTGWFVRPVPIGISTGNQGECSAGTISARVKDKNGNVFAMSNNHVYAIENTAASNSAILQPGLYDTNCNFNNTNVIGNLSSFIPIDISSSATNTVDAAIASSSTSALGNSTPANGYGIPRSEIVSPRVGQDVMKYGRTTSLTSGRVTGINATILIGYNAGTARFVNQIVIGSSKPFIKAGDSGSLLVTNPNADPVGLLFAGSSSGTTAIANPIDLVLNALGVIIDGK